jgi:nicotinate-nucleotide pyrophosphorylase
MGDLQTSLNVREMLANFLQEDVGAGDITSNNIIPKGLEATAREPPS